MRPSTLPDIVWMNVAVFEGGEFDIEVSLHATVGQVKAQIEEVTHIPVVSQILCIFGNALERDDDQAPLSRYTTCTQIYDGLLWHGLPPSQVPSDESMPLTRGSIGAASLDGGGTCNHSDGDTEVGDASDRVSHQS